MIHHAMTSWAVTQVFPQPQNCGWALAWAIRCKVYAFHTYMYNRTSCLACC